MSTLLFIIIILAAVTYYLACKRVTNKSNIEKIRPDSLLRYYGINAFVWTFVPAFLILLLYSFMYPIIAKVLIIQQLTEAFPNKQPSELDLLYAQIQNIAAGVLIPTENLKLYVDSYVSWISNAQAIRIFSIISLSVFGALYVLKKTNPFLRARVKVEIFIRRLFFVAAVVAVLTTIAIVLSLLFEALRFFAVYNFFDFIFGTHWSPNMAIRDDQVGSSGSFGMIPVMAGTLLVALIAMLVSVPIGLFSAIYMTTFAPTWFRDIAKPALEVLAGIPTVVYGFFAALMAAPFFRNIGLSVGLDVSSESALAAGVVMGVMIIPFISSLSDDVITAVPQSLKDGSIGLGATKAETIRRVVLPAALPGLIGAFLLAISRAIGETMIVVMAAGTAANLTANPLESVTTVTVQIVGLLTGDTVFDSPKTLSAFALGITLFAITLILNVAALSVSRKFSEKYD